MVSFKTYQFHDGPLVPNIIRFAELLMLWPHFHWLYVTPVETSFVYVSLKIKPKRNYYFSLLQTTKRQTLAKISNILYTRSNYS